MTRYGMGNAMTERPPPVRGKRAAEIAEAPRHGRARAVSELMPGIGHAAFKRFGFVQSAVVSRWPEIVGERYATASSPESIRFPAGKRIGGTLTLTVDSAHAPMMQHVAPAIIERVNRFFGYDAVARVAIRQGAAPRAPAVAQPQPSRHQPAELGDSLRAVGDPELLEVLQSLARGLSLTEGPPRFEEPR
jgi:hypothetical protein